LKCAAKVKRLKLTWGRFVKNGSKKGKTGYVKPLNVSC
jgi:hypothetical protein